MARPFKFRYVNEIVGGFVLLVLLLLVAGIVAAGRMQGWMDERRDYEIVLPADEPTGLRKGSDVYIYSTAVGSVRSMRVGEDGIIRAEIRVRGDLIRFMREDSEAIVRKKFGVAGDAYIEITRGEGQELVEGAVIQASLDEDLTAMLINAVRDISDSAKLTIFQVNRLLSEYTTLASSLGAPVDQLGNLLITANALAADLQAGEGSAGKVLKDPALHAELLALLEDTRGSVKRLDEVLVNAREASAGMPAVVDQAPEVMEQVEDTLAQLERLIESLQRHWLVRRYVEEEAAPEFRIAPGAGKREP